MSKELLAAKLKLYNLLITKDCNELTPVEFKMAGTLTVDPDIQFILEQKRKKTLP